VNLQWTSSLEHLIALWVGAREGMVLFVNRPDMRLKQLAVGKIEEAGRTLGRAGGAQVFQVG